MEGNYSLPVNIGNPDEYKVKDFAVLIKELTQSNSTIKSLPATRDDPKQRRPDISTAKKYLDWSPKVPVRVGLAKTIEYFRQVKTPYIL
jgi:UDP-glucuronate decarboxylase